MALNFVDAAEVAGAFQRAPTHFERLARIKDHGQQPIAQRLVIARVDLIQRGSRMFERLVVSVLRNDSKKALFSVEERTEMLREVLRPYTNVQVDSFQGLLVEHAAAHSATVLLRGIRAISDYEYEWQMALMNRRLRPEIEAVFMMAMQVALPAPIRHQFSNPAVLTAFLAFLAVLLRLWVTAGELLLAAIGYTLDYKREGALKDLPPFPAHLKNAEC